MRSSMLHFLHLETESQRGWYVFWWRDLTMIFRAELVRGRSDIGQVCQLNACHPGSHFVSVFLEHSEQYHDLTRRTSARKAVDVSG